MKTKIVLILILTNIILACLSSHALPTLEKLLAILAAIRSGNQNALQIYPQNEISEAESIFSAATGSVISAPNQNSNLCNINGRNVVGNFSIIGGHVYTNSGFFNINQPNKNELKISGTINNLYTHSGDVNCYGDISSATVTNGSIKANKILGNALANNGSINVSGNINGSVTANNGSVRR